MPVVFKNKMTCKALAKKNKNLVSKRQLNTTHGAKSPRPLCDRPASPHRSRCGEIQAELLRVQLPVHITVFTQLEFELFSLSQASTPSPPPPPPSGLQSKTGHHLLVHRPRHGGDHGPPQCPWNGPSEEALESVFLGMGSRRRRTAEFKLMLDPDGPKQRHIPAKEERDSYRVDA